MRYEVEFYDEKRECGLGVWATFNTREEAEEEAKKMNDTLSAHDRKNGQYEVFENHNEEDEEEE